MAKAPVFLTSLVALFLSKGQLDFGKSTTSRRRRGHGRGKRRGASVRGSARPRGQSLHDASSSTARSARSSKKNEIYDNNIIIYTIFPK